MKFKWCDGGAHSKCVSLIGIRRKYKTRVQRGTKTVKVKKVYRDVWHCDCWCNASEQRMTYSDVVEAEKENGIDLL